MSIFSYLVIVCISVFLMFISIKGIFYEKHIIIDFVNTFRTNTVQVTMPVGVSLEINASRKDRELAWKIYTQIKTRIAVEEFNEEIDSIQVVNKSLYESFIFIRQAISELPVSVIRDDHKDLLQLYFDLLNKGIRPYLSKWHIPISHWNESELKKHPELTLIQIEKKFPQRADVLNDLKDMNELMKDFSEILFRIAKGENYKVKLNSLKLKNKVKEENCNEH